MFYLLGQEKCTFFSTTNRLNQRTRSLIGRCRNEQRSEDLSRSEAFALKTNSSALVWLGEDVELLMEQTEPQQYLPEAPEHLT